MALTVKGTPTSSATTSVTLPTHAVGDMIIIYATNQNSASAPSKPTPTGTVPAWNTIQTGPGTGTTTGVAVYFVATATNHTSGTWTSPNGMIAIVLTGQNASPIGAFGATGGTTLDCTAPAVTLTKTDGTSMILELFSARSGGASPVWGTTPTGYTSQVANATGKNCLLTKNDTTSDGSVTQPRTSATAGYEGQTIEILAATTSGTTQNNFLAMF